MSGKFFETIISGEGLVSKTVSDDLVKATKPLDAFHGEDVSGSVRDGLSGEVLMEMQDGVLHIPVDTQVKMLRDIADTDPETAKGIMQVGVMAALADPSPHGSEQFVALMELMEELYGSEEATKFILELTMSLFEGASLAELSGLF